MSDQSQPTKLEIALDLTDSLEGAIDRTRAIVSLAAGELTPGNTRVLPAEEIGILLDQARVNLVSIRADVLALWETFKASVDCGADAPNNSTGEGSGAPVGA